MILRELVDFAHNPGITIPENLAEVKVVFPKEFTRTDLESYFKSETFDSDMEKASSLIKGSGHTEVYLTFSSKNRLELIS